MKQSEFRECRGTGLVRVLSFDGENAEWDICYACNGNEANA